MLNQSEGVSLISNIHIYFLIFIPVHTIFFESFEKELVAIKQHVIILNDQMSIVFKLDWYFAHSW